MNWAVFGILSDKGRPAAGLWLPDQAQDEALPFRSALPNERIDHLLLPRMLVIWCSVPTSGLGSCHTQARNAA